MLRNKKIVLLVTASIAAYKAAVLVRLLIKEGAQVKVILTPQAKDFITPLTLSTLSKNPVLSEFTRGNSGEWNNHVELGLWADVMLVAPASANTIAKMAYGLCDNLALAVYLSAKCPVIIAPAMDLDMYRHPATLANLSTLKKYGNQIIASNYGELASGLVGEGRMAEPEEIRDFVSTYFSKNLPLAGKTALVTAGPTYEAIDAVRFLGNNSSGKMGIAIAEALANQGAQVHLVIGPSALKTENPSIKRTDVVSAEDMWKASESLFKQADIAVLSAAVADFKPKSVQTKKIKKASGFNSIELVETVDILASLGKLKKKHQILVGFALETDNEIENAKLKIKKKNLDFIVLNSLNDKGAGFKHDTNKITIIDAQNKIQKFELKSKQEVAQDIVTKIKAYFKK
ncbi:MAG: bifunctional phosphopantothenoylcysteine decarboxylase/phosphopantothenate--cysteine ligase CoaBC [Bacteroidetes bacterium]|nr:bifunctional phosphopantothenoylcysteine decarboxylase/phosphopantothenate--cysteine ligase CoaBC [Bacteroidota bacterium]